MSPFSFLHDLTGPQSPAPILIVDDSNVSRQTLGLIAQKVEGTRLVFAGSGTEALASANGVDFAAILLDVDMPDMNGYELARRLKQNPATAATPILFVTALSPTPKMLEEAYESGAVDFLVKPPLPAVLCAKLQIFCDMYQNRRRLELLNRELETLTDAAQSASQAKSAFVANMSHEIRTPLNGILGTVELLGKTPLSAQQKRYTDIITSSGEALLGILSDILDLSKIEAGRTHINKETIPLDDFLSDAVHPHIPRAAVNRIELLMQFGADVPETIHTDPVLLKQILFNLLSNAVKFTQSGFVRLDIERETAGSLTFKVQDTGIGIPADRLNTVFDAFTQADPSTTRNYGGTGLGLAITRNLVHLLDGTISVQSTKGQGSIFTVTLPIPEDSAASSHAHKAALSAAADQPLTLAVPEDMVGAATLANLTALGFAPTRIADCHPSTLQKAKAGPVVVAQSLLAACAPEDLAALFSALGPRLVVLQALNDPPERIPPGPYRLLHSLHTRADLKALFAPPAFAAAQYKPLSPAIEASGPSARQTLLLAEDDPVNRMIACEILDDLGYNVVIAENGLRAVEQARGQKFATILMDCMMPNMDGYQATSLIRATDNLNRDTPIIAITASVMESDRQKCFGAGMNDFLGKPFRSRDLAEKLKTWVKG